MVTCADCGRSLAGQKRKRWAGGLHDERRPICDLCSAMLMGMKVKIHCMVCHKVIGYRLVFGAKVKVELWSHNCNQVGVAKLINFDIKIVLSDAVPPGEVHLIANRETMAKITGGDDGG